MTYFLAVDIMTAVCFIAVIGIGVVGYVLDQRNPYRE